MTIDELKNYRKLSFSIRYWKREYEDLTKASYTKSPQLTGLPTSGELSDPTSERAMKELKMLSRIQRMIAEQEEETERIMEWIETIEDPIIKVIMHARYIKAKSWAAVAMAVGGNNTPDGIRMMHNRYLFALFDKKN